MTVIIFAVSCAAVIGFGFGAMVGYIRCTRERDDYDYHKAQEAKQVQAKQAAPPAPNVGPHL